MQRRAPWPDVLPAPPAAAALVLCVLAFGVMLGDAMGPQAVAAPSGAPVTLALAPVAALVPTRTPTPEPPPAPASAPAAAPAAVAPAPAVPAAPAPAVTTAASPSATSSPGPTAAPDPAQPPIHHVAVLRLSGSAATALAADSPAPYLATKLRPQATVLSEYTSLGHGPVADGLALVSGRRPDAAAEAGCVSGCDFRDGSVPALSDRLADAGRGARGYQQDACDAFAPRNPLSYFGAECAPFDQLGGDLGDADTAPALALIAPSDCDAGVPGTCPPGEADGLARADALASVVVPAVLQSATFADNGALLVIFDAGGALVVSPFSASGATSDVTYDPYAVARTLADVFEVEPLGRAAGARVTLFGDDVWVASGR